MFFFTSSILSLNMFKHVSNNHRSLDSYPGLTKLLFLLSWSFYPRHSERLHVIFKLNLEKSQLNGQRLLLNPASSIAIRGPEALARNWPSVKLQGSRLVTDVAFGVS